MSASNLPAIRPVYEAGAVERVEVDAVYLPSTLPTLADLEIIDRIAARAAASAYVAGARTPERAAMLILAGRELRVGPWQALSGIHIIKERPSISAHLMGALVQRFIREQRGGIFRVTEHTAQRCTIEYRRPEWAESGFVTWTIEDAKRAGLIVPEGNWHKYPRQMLFSRATGEAARAGFPDVVQGLYTPEELDDVPAAAPVEAPPPSTVAASVTPRPDGSAEQRSKALEAIHGLIRDRYDGDAHDGLKAIQPHLFGADDPRATASFSDADVWTLDELRNLYRRIGPLSGEGFAMVIGPKVVSDDNTETKDSGDVVVTVAGRQVDAETGEVLGDAAPMTEREQTLAQWREIAQAADSLDDWRLACDGIGLDAECWGIFADEARTVGAVNMLRGEARTRGAMTPELEQRFNARAKALRALAAATTP